LLPHVAPLAAFALHAPPSQKKPFWQWVSLVQLVRHAAPAASQT